MASSRADLITAAVCSGSFMLGVQAETPVEAPALASKGPGGAPPSLTRHGCAGFVYPYGVWNQAALPHVQAAGDGAAFQLTSQPPDPQRPLLLTIRRVLVPSSWDNRTLLARLATP